MRAWHKILLLAALCAGAVLAYNWWRAEVLAEGHASGRAEVQAAWDGERLEQQRATIDEARANAQETQRRLDRQKANQDAQDLELAAARRDVVIADAAAGRLRDQNAAAARAWRDVLGHPAAGGQCPAAVDAIGVLADVLGRADRRAGILAGYADAARIAGLKCERDYDSLTGAAPREAQVLIDGSSGP